MERFCPHCGKKIGSSSSTKFCFFCGKKIPERFREQMGEVHEVHEDVYGSTDPIKVVQSTSEVVSKKNGESEPYVPNLPEPAYKSEDVDIPTSEKQTEYRIMLAEKTKLETGEIVEEKAEKKKFTLSNVLLFPIRRLHWPKMGPYNLLWILWVPAVVLLLINIFVVIGVWLGVWIPIAGSEIFTDELKWGSAGLISGDPGVFTVGIFTKGIFCLGIINRCVFSFGIINLSMVCVGVINLTLVGAGVVGLGVLFHVSAAIAVSAGFSMGAIATGTFVLVGVIVPASGLLGGAVFGLTAFNPFIAAKGREIPW